MVLSVDDRKTELIDKLATDFKGQVPPLFRDAAERFVRNYFALVAPDDILYTAPETLKGGAQSLWDFGEVRGSEEAKVRLFNPAIESNGWALEHTVLEIVNDDMPFLVDSVTAELNNRERSIHLLIHPVITVQRDQEGRRVSLPTTGSQEGSSSSISLISESYMHIEFDHESDPAELEAIRTSVESTLSKVRVAVKDWRAMRQQLAVSITELEGRTDLPMPAEEVEEAKAFLRWLDDGNYIFLGYRKYSFKTEASGDFLALDPTSGLGILREVRPESLKRSATAFSEEFSAYARRKDLLIITKANNRSPVHRAVPMDRVGIKIYDTAGNLMGEHRFLGLFTSAAYSRSVRDIPMLRLKATRALEHAGLPAGSHDAKAMMEILETLPRDEFFQISEDDLFHTSLGILQLQDRERVALFVRKDVFERFVSCLVLVPRDRYNAEFRERARVVLEEAFEGKVTAVNTQLSDSPLARTNFIVHTPPGQIRHYDVKRIEAYLAEAARTWSDKLLDTLVEHKGEEEGLALHRQYKHAFPTAYAERFPAPAAVYDIGQIQEVARTGELKVDLYRHRGDDERQFHCKIIHSGPPLALSDLMPRLEHMGVKVQSEVPFNVTPAGATEPIRIRDFSLAAIGLPDDLKTLKAKAEETFLRVWKRDAEDDGFNRLVVHAGLEWREVVVLRAYSKYLRQTGVAISESSIQQTLASNPAITIGLVELFKTLFEPKGERSEVSKSSDSLRAEILSALEEVTNPEEDRILRIYLNLIEATLRTNYFQADANGAAKSYLSFKLDSLKVTDLPLPRPMVEIFVYSPRMEGIHLRGGKVARGGIRWSDRRDDFRTEILGLMKAQTVKNVVIVPVGSKGGFVVKNPPQSRDEMQKEGIECYKILLRGMLDLTDNLSANAIIPPPQVVRRDGDDAYLVVAADKGTATFSDIANAISADYGFWLGDAFASGGSAGYDHKKMAITARGGWEAVKRHFRELGVDTQAEDFTVVGVGDMSGDVFGNAMLLSPHIRLVGAFNHMHIFVDPNPDAATSFPERERLFNLPRSNWTDYNSALLSPGGAILDRRAKSLVVSEEVRERFELPGTTVTPGDLMRAILKASADLLWLGGIGTYVKSSDEAHVDARDRANDAFRVNGRDLRVRVVGEGANLGFTQKGRVEFALTGQLTGGGKINTDAIDNSAGVDCSDHEVNIKILVDEAVAQGEIKLDQRLALLSEMTDEVARLVLRDNYQQTQAISIAEAKGESLLDRQARFMRSLERAGRLDRSLEALPDDESITARHSLHLGLTRPELAVLLAYSKISLYQDLLSSDLPDDPQLVEDLILYFPKQLRERYRAAIERHRLRREIIATFITNTMVNRVGPTFVAHIMEESGKGVNDIARAFAIIRDSFGLRGVFKGIERLDNKVHPSVQTNMMLEVERLLERTMLWLLRSGYARLDISAYVARFRPRIQALTTRLEGLLPPTSLATLREREAGYVKLGIPATLAREMANLEVLSSAGDIVKIADGDSGVSGTSSSTAISIDEVGRVYFGIGERFDLDRLRTAASAIAPESLWQKTAITNLIDDLFMHQTVLTSRVVKETSKGEMDATSAQSPRAAATGTAVAAPLPPVSLVVPQSVQNWLDQRVELVSRTDQMIAELRAAPVVDLSMLTVAARQFQTLAAS
ncbi:MAG TPA: NAD-glutamate dehydrogenase [Thermoanaerobaculia bacterium]|nr:NAD-glutamate dehydrogenase [Thermoanaerobaculia bacterium]